MGLKWTKTRNKCCDTKRKESERELNGFKVCCNVDTVTYCMYVNITIQFYRFWVHIAFLLYVFINSITIVFKQLLLSHIKQ